MSSSLEMSLYTTTPERHTCGVLIADPVINWIGILWIFDQKLRR